MILNAIVFLCGAALMGLELLGARVLAPTMATRSSCGEASSRVQIALRPLGYGLGTSPDRYGSTHSLGVVHRRAGLSTAGVSPLIAGACLEWAGPSAAPGTARGDHAHLLRPGAAARDGLSPWACASRRPRPHTDRPLGGACTPSPRRAVSSARWPPRSG